MVADTFKVTDGVELLRDIAAVLIGEGLAAQADQERTELAISILNRPFSSLIK